MSKTKLICITGKMGSGKTTMTNFLKASGYSTFIFDEYINSIYKKNEIGYIRIKKFLGNEFVNEDFVDKKKLLDYILISSENKYKLDSIMIPIIEKKIRQLIKLGTVFVELGIYIYFPYIFKKYFKYVVVVDNTNVTYKKDVFFMLNKNVIFSTKRVENSNNTLFSNVIFCDFIVENCGNLEFFYKKIKNLLNYFQ